MSNFPPNSYKNLPAPPPTSMQTGSQAVNHNPPYGQVPLSQLPPGYGGIKQDTNSNSPVPQISSPLQNVNNYNSSASSSPAFNNPGMSSQSSPSRPHLQPVTQNLVANTSYTPPNSIIQSFPQLNSNQSQFAQKQQSNVNAPPFIPSSHLNKPFTNGPPSGPPLSSPLPGQYPPSTSNQLLVNRPPSGPGFISLPSVANQVSLPQPVNLSSQANASLPAPLLSGPPRSSPVIPGPPATGNLPGGNGPPVSVNGSLQGTSLPVLSTTVPKMPPSMPQGMSVSQSTSSGQPFPNQSFQYQNGPGQPMMPPNGPFGQTGQVNSHAVLRPPIAPQNKPPTMQSMPKPLGQPPIMNQPYPGPQTQLARGPSPMRQGQMAGQPLTGPSPVSQQQIGGPPLGSQEITQPLTGQAPMSQPKFNQSIVSQPSPISQPTLGQPPLGRPPMGQSPMNQQPVMQAPASQAQYMQPPLPQQQLNNQYGQMASQPPQPPGGPPPAGISGMQNRYPQMQSNYGNHQVVHQKQQYPQQYNAQGITQQMGQLSVTKQGFDQLWGHNQVDLLQCRHILPEYPEDPPEIRLDHQFADSPNCSPEIFRCTLNRIPESNNLLQKSRLPLGILIHPFKDLNHLPVIQCSTIVRCRACRTYINPFVYFVDSKRWKCNLCYRVNDLPDEFQYDPVSKSYGDPSRRPEIKSATIEFIAPGEYMLRPPQPAVYLFLMDISQIGRESGYLKVMCDTLKNCLDELPGDARTQVGFICYDAHVHYYLMGDGSPRPKEMTVLDIDEIFLPSPESLLVNIGERRDLVNELLTLLPQRHTVPTTPASALGAALQAAYKLMAPTGGRITVFQTCLPNVGPGALQPREDPNARSSKEVNHLNPATDFYKRLALDCSGAQIAVDLFLLSSQYCDMATLSGMSKFSGGTVYHIPLFRAARAWQAECFRRMLTRYITRKIGFEAVMRVRCTRGIAIHTFHGNFFVRSTDLLSLPNVSPDAGFGMQLAIEEPLTNLQQVCFQAALLYTSSKGERRIRVHTLALPVATNLTEVLHSADQQAIIGLVSKMAVDRCASASMSEAREALMNVAIDALSAHKLAQNLPAGSMSSSLMAPANLRLLPLYISALLKRKAFRTGTSTRLDDRVADMCDVKTLPLHQLLRAVYPDLYPIHTLREYALKPEEDDEEVVPDPPRLHLSAEKINSNGAYLLDDGETMILYVCHAVSPAFLSEVFGVTSFSQLPDEVRSLPSIESEGNILLHSFIEKLNDDRPYASNILVLRDNSANKTIFTERLVDDRVEHAFSYYEFLQHVKTQVK